MKSPITFQHEFVRSIPENLAERTLYISVEYATAVHMCGCGCGREVVTPLSPTDWKLAFDGVSISLHPSIGNWNFPCQSHYWIQRNTVLWAEAWSKGKIAGGRAYDQKAKERYFSPPEDSSQQTKVGIGGAHTKSLWETFKDWWCR